ncbi:cupin domain-containing protein [Xanthobacter dioxanivorans]|uniref:Cupin domain-containing protein n=1 Tax=Xanthobacter dioxanivorans TaxID=2528964 RepID=A0A974SJG6_9HYPH|nr:cupin domain-containing protein [Xanthobacter dioxanivorans]QRG07765.1 cupin domain-containing protein [Xanthobacter dioxanivorans]
MSDISDFIVQGVAAKEEAEQAPRLQVGTRLRHARLLAGARLKDIAEAANCSESLLSKLENNKIQPSLNMLARVCEALHLTIGELFATPDADQEVVQRTGQRMVVELDPLRRGEGIRMERLIPYAKGHLLQGNVHIVAAGGGSDGLVAHEGEEVGYVLCGRIELLLGDKIFNVNAGDSFTYRSEIPHGYRNIGEEEARIIFINTPPSF